MLNTYCQNVLVTELKKVDYGGMTASQAWSWLMDPVTTTMVVPTNVLLTPALAAKVLGPKKANALAKKATVALPDIGASLMQVGVNLSDPITADFLKELVDGSVIADADVNGLVALGRKTVTVVGKPRFDLRFEPSLWPHVAEDGTQGKEGDQAIHGFPNTITREEFNTAWAVARG